MSYDLDKLGTVLAVANQMNRDMLEMLKTAGKADKDNMGFSRHCSCSLPDCWCRYMVCF